MVHIIGEESNRKKMEQIKSDQKSAAAEEAVKDALLHLEKFFGVSCRLTFIVRNPADEDQNHYFISNDDPEFKERILSSIWPAVEVDG